MRIGLSLKLSEPKYNVLAQNIRALFADGSQGWWYDDNDTTTLFQDSAGTTPVTAVEQFVGLQLDKSKGLVLGPELVTNGDFSSAAGWTGAGDSFSIANGIATLTRTTTFTYYQSTAFSVTAGKWYWITGSWLRSSGTGQATFQVRDNTGGTVRFQQDASPGTSFQPFQYAWLATATETVYLRVGVVNAAASVQVDLVSLRELPGNHRYAPASSNRPIWSKRVNLLTKTEQFDDAVWVNTIAGTGVAATVTADQGTAPDGTNTADRIQFNLGGGTTTSDITRRRQSYTTPASSHTFSVYLRSFDGVSSYNMHIVGPDGGTNNIVVTGAWQRFAVTATGTGSAVAYAVGLRGGQTPANSNTADILVWGADLRPANQATGLLPLYQRVNTSTDYNTNDFPGYLKADGVDDFLQTNSIDFSAGPTNPPLGPELVVNGDFSQGTTGWSATNSTLSATSNQLTITSTANFGIGASTGFTTVIGRLYRVTAQLVSCSSSTARIRKTDSATDFNSNAVHLVNGTGWTPGQTFTMYFQATATTTYVMGVTDLNPSNITIDNVSVKEITNANLGADKITLCAGVRKLSDAATGTVTDQNGATGTNSFMLRAPAGATATYAFYSGGSVAFGGSALSPASYTSPITNVLTGVGDISGDSAILRINGAQAVAATGDQGTGNYSNLPVYFFRRQGTALQFTGYEYGNVAVGKLLTADQLTALETYMNGLTKAY